MDSYNKLTRGAFHESKLQLASELLENNGIVIPRKATVLLEWITNVLIKTSEKRAELYVQSEINFHPLCSI